MLSWDIFYFLWDDPLFTFASSIEDWELKDYEFIALRRTLRLAALELLYIRIQTLEGELAREKQHHREAQAREAWTINQFLEKVPWENGEAILIDRKVNHIDPEFSFEKALDRYNPSVL